MNEHEPELHDLIEQLQAQRPSTPEPGHSFTSQLRGRLLAKYDKKPGWELGRLTSTATALAVLALVIFVGWYIASSQQPAMIAGEAIQITRMAETAETANQLEAIHSTLRASQMIDEAYTWNATINYWQTTDGRYSRTMITDPSGKLLHFAQSDGRYLWQSVGINAITSQNRRVLDFNQQTLNDSATLQSEVATPFYSDLGWDGLVELLVSSELDCSTHECVEQMVELALVDEALPNSGAYGWGISLIGTVEENGRTLNVYHIGYSSGVSPEPLPQYRQVKIDANTFDLVSITDYNGERVIRSIERLSQEQLMMGAQDFQGIPSDALVAMATRPKQTFTFENGLQIAGYVLLPESSNQDNLHFTIFWQSEEAITNDNYRGIVHVVNEKGALVTEANTSLQWQTTNDETISLISVRDIEQWSNGRYQIYAGIYDQAAGKNLLSDSGQEMVLLDTIVIEDSAVPADTTTIGDYSFEAQGSIWPISLSQAARTSVNENINVEMIIGYDLSDLPEGDYVLKLHYAAPDWEQVTTGRSPIDGMSDYLPLTEPEGELTINFSGNPQEMQSIVGTASPIPVLILGQLHELSGGGQQFEALATVTSGEFPLLLDSIEATTYRIVDEEPQN